jgi:endonuclease YncB( thermonuclease family)
MHILKPYALFGAFLLCFSMVSGETITGKVVGIKDGDTIVVFEQNRQVIVRLAGIDAPEKKQAFGQRAKEAMSDCAFDKEAVVEWHKLDRYGRTIGKAIVGGTDCGRQLLDKGLAWHYKAYSKEQTSEDRHTYAESEVRAQQAQIGLWTDSNPEPPWEFRHRPK